MTKTEMKAIRTNMVGAMNDYILHLNNEDAYMAWIEVVPDCMTEDDAVFIAENEELWVNTCHLFGELVTCYVKDGEVVSEG